MRKIQKGFNQMKIHSHHLIACVGVALLSIGLSSRAAETNSAVTELKQRQEQLTLENGGADQQLRQELAKLTAEKQRLDLENSIAQQKLQAEIAPLAAEIDKLTKQADLLAKRIALKEAERRAQFNDE